MLEKHRLMQLAGLLPEAMLGGSANSFRSPGHMAKVNQAQEIERELNDGEDTVPSDELVLDLDLD